MSPTPVTHQKSSRPWISNPNVLILWTDSLDVLDSLIKKHRDTLQRHDEMIKEDGKRGKATESRLDSQAKEIEGLKQRNKNVEAKAQTTETRLDAQAKKIEGLKQLNTDVEAQAKADTARLRSKLDAEIVRNQRIDELSNQFVAREAITDAKFENTDRAVQELAGRTELLERASNIDRQRIVDLGMDIECRFETAVVYTQEGLRHNQIAWAEGLENLRIETTQNTNTATTQFSTAFDTMKAQVHEHTNTLVKTDDVLARINDVLECTNPRFEELETAMDL